MSSSPEQGLNCVICGVGGQGNVLASRLVAQVLLDRNEHVKTAETIGMAQRGGSVTSHVRGGHPSSPLVPQHTADALIAFEPAEAVRCIDLVRDGGTVIVNTAALQPPTAALAGSDYDGSEARAYLEELEQAGTLHVVFVDGDEICRTIGNPKVLNVVLLASAVQANALGISRAELEKAIQAQVKPEFHDLNLQAVAQVFD